MADAAPGYVRRPDEPQCYNCGTVGHWAIGCPEPTRQTPAGLEAWRNTSNSGQAQVKDHRGGNKKSKGPIITRYAPPPPQHAGYQPQPTYYQQPPQYPGHPYPQPVHPPNPPHSSQAPQPPHPPAYHPPHPAHYPQPPPPPHNYPAYPQPGPHYSSGYQPPAAYHTQPVPPPSYSQPPLPNAPPRPDLRNKGYAQTNPPAPPYLPPHPHAPPIAHAPGSFPIAGAPPARPQGGPSSQRRGSGHSPEKHRQQRNQQSNPRNGNRRASISSQPSKKGSGPGSTPVPIQRPPSTAMSPGERILHGLPPKPPGLPPKPPAPVGDRPDMRRDKNRKKEENQKPNRDSKSKDQPGNKRSSNQNKNRNKRRQSQQEPPAAKSSQATEIDQGDVQPDGQRGVSTHTDIPMKEIGQDIESSEVVAEVIAPKPEEITNESEGEVEFSEFDWGLESIFKAPEPFHEPDEVGRPLPNEFTEEVLLPRKWDAKCIESKFFSHDDMEQFCQPVHETRFWEYLQFDPSFIRDGKLPSGDPLPRPSPVKKSPTGDEPPPPEHRGKSPLSVARSAERTERRKRTGSESHSDRTGMVERHEPRDFHDRRRFSQGNRRIRSPDASNSQNRRQRRDDSSSWDRDSPRYRRDPRSRSPRPVSPRRDHRGRETSSRRHVAGDHERRPPPRSRGSSVSSSSSHSSGLDSLDCELLGIEPKDKRQREEDRDREDSDRAPKPKRRRVQLDSAYSRRW